MKVGDKLHPTEIPKRAFALERAEFARGFGGDMLLLVRLEGSDDGMRRALVECPTDRGHTWQPRSEPTYTATAIQRIMPASTDAPLAIGVRAARADWSKQLVRAPHYVMPLRKRLEASTGDPERISVGRSRACDIVLFHPTVSKLHAWLEHDDNERLYVSDCGSLNFTRVRGRIIEAHSLVTIELGEEMSFGDVTVRVCTPELVWDVLHEQHG